MKQRAAPDEDLSTILRIADREDALLEMSDRMIFPADQPVDADWTATVADDPERGAFVEAFASRFARFQDRLEERVLPGVLDALAENVGRVIDNITRAERLGWVDDAEDWINTRNLRNRLVHEYIEDPVQLASDLNTAGRYARMRHAVVSRGLVADPSAS
jgi:hypothetical protein